MPRCQAVSSRCFTEARTIACTRAGGSQTEAGPASSTSGASSAATPLQRRCRARMSSRCSTGARTMACTRAGGTQTEPGRVNSASGASSTATPLSRRCPNCRTEVGTTAYTRCCPYHAYTGWRNIEGSWSNEQDLGGNEISPLQSPATSRPAVRGIHESGLYPRHVRITT